jgi:hypothetical protein
MISIVDNLSESEEDQANDILATEIIARKTYVCPALKLPKGKEVIKTESNKDGYIFDITKVNLIFYHLLKDRQIRLSQSQ